MVFHKTKNRISSIEYLGALPRGSFIKVMGSLGTSEADTKSEISFNNPFDSELTFNTNEKIKQVEIFDESGRLVLKETNKNQLNTAHLTKGVYFIKLTMQSDRVISKKAIKN